MLGGVDRDADIARLAQFGDMEVVRRIGAAHVERVFGPVGADHAEIGQEFFLLVEIGRAQPPISEIEGFDYRHDTLPEMRGEPILGYFAAPGDSPVARRCGGRSDLFARRWGERARPIGRARRIVYNSKKGGREG